MSEPYKFKARTPQRGQSWESVAQQLNGIHQPGFRVTARSVRDRFSLLSTKYAQKLRMEERASGVEVEQTELDSLLEEILERENDAKKELNSKDREKKSKAGKEKATAEEVRKRAMERMTSPKLMIRRTNKRNRRSEGAPLMLLITLEREIEQRKRV